MLKKRNLIIRFGILFMLIGIVALSSGCSSKRMSKNHNRAFESYADMLDRSEERRVAKKLPRAPNANSVGINGSSTVP